MKKFEIIFLLFSFLAVSSCQTNSSDNGVQGLSFKDRARLHIKELPDPQIIDVNGPFGFEVATDQVITLAPKDQILADMFIPAQVGTSPLVVFIHGNKFSKTAHRKQAEALASFGFHVMTLDAPKTNQWLENGHRLKKLIKMVYSVPSVISPRVDRNQIILVGHSFGGSAVITAAAQGAPVKGLILLDPAVYDDIIIDYQKMLKLPVVMLGADPKVFLSRRRSTFSKNISAPFAEVSVTGATHNDAQFPTLEQDSAWKIDFETELHKQKTFRRLIVSSALALSSKNLGTNLKNYLGKESQQGNLIINSDRLQKVKVAEKDEILDH